MIMTMKDEADIISVKLNWLCSIGFRRFVIADNNSLDDSLRLAEEFRRYAWNAEVIIIRDPIVRYAQSEKTTNLMRLAASYWSDCGWIFPIDADAFLVAANGVAFLYCSKTYFVEQMNRVSVIRLFEEMDNHQFDLIIDDGLHTFEANRIFLEDAYARLSAGHEAPKVKAVKLDQAAR
jgi:hypothetical protein